MRLAERLKHLRTQKKICQKELAIYLNCSTGTVSNYENGVHLPDPQTLVNMAAFYGVSVDYLLGFTDCPDSVDTMNQSIAGSYTVSDFMQLVKLLPKGARHYLVYELRLLEHYYRSK